MKKSIHLLFFLLIMQASVFRAFSQEKKPVIIARVNTFIDSLKSNGISKIGFKKDYCVSCMSWIQRDSNGQVSFKCYMYFTFYLFWQKGENGFIKKFDACGPSNEISIDPKVVFEYPDKYSDKMKKEQLKPFSLLESIKPNGDSILSYSWRDHGGVCELLFINGKDSMYQEIDFYNLDKGSDGVPNQSYESNKKLKIVEWEQILSDIISKLEKEEKFKR